MSVDAVNWSAVRTWVEIAQLIGTAGLWVYVRIVTRSRINHEAIARMEQRVAALAGRVEVMEADLRHLPNHADLAHLHEKVNTVANGMEGLRGELVAINRTLGLINEHLINHGDRR